MKRILLRIQLIITCSLICACATDNSKFTGRWGTKDKKDGDFTIDLVQTDNQIQGYHSAVALHGNRIDAVLPEEGKPSIAGTVIDNIASVQFRSGYSSATGDATITHQNNKLVWTINSSTPGHYFPGSAVLYPQK